MDQQTAKKGTRRLLKGKKTDKTKNTVEIAANLRELNKLQAALIALLEKQL